MAKEIIKTIQGGRNGSVVTVEKKIEPLPVMTILPKDRIREFVDGVIEHAQKEDSLRLQTYFNSRGVMYATMLEWQNKFPELKQACDLAKEIIGSRREEGALKGKLSPAVVLRTQPIYDKEYRELREWEAKLTAREEALSSAGQKVVIMERFRETDVVPVKEKE